MPSRPRRGCRVEGCRNLAEPGKAYCTQHRRQQDVDYNRYHRDQELQAFYCSREWRETRKIQLERFPLCAECAKDGRVTPATIVDHIKPIRDGGARLDLDNLQSLCWACHSRKSVEEGSRFGKRVRKDEDEWE